MTEALECFLNKGGYQLLPFRFARVPGVSGKVLLVSDVGEFLFIAEDAFGAFVEGTLTADSELFYDLQARNLLVEKGRPIPLRSMASKYRTKKCFMKGGPALHEFVVTLRCDHSCGYCQASRRSVSDVSYDMSPEIADAAVDRMFDSPALELTIEFQGGEPLLAFDIIQRVTERAVERNQLENRRLKFTAVSTLHHLTSTNLEFFRQYDFQLCTSLDGPEWLHNANRPCSENSFERTVDGIQRAREVLGHDRVTALTTVTRQSLGHAKAIIDTYVSLGFGSVFLRPLSPYGFAAKTIQGIGYSTAEFLHFYDHALDYIIDLNRAGFPMEEAYAGILLTHILTPFPTGYVDLRSPCGGGIGTMVYNFDGGVYLCDEARMLAAMGNDTFRLGCVTDSYENLIRSDAIMVALNSSITEALPGCVDCAYQPFCGECPVYSLARHGDPIGHRPTSGHCAKQKGFFDALFRRLAAADPQIMAIFLGWSLQQPIGGCPAGGGCG